MSERYIEIKTVNRKMLLLYGDKLTGTQKAIGHRSNGLHVELRFSDRYGRISFSCTLADGVGGCRFKMIGYSHGYRWSTVRIAVTEEQEARLFAKACEMAGMELETGVAFATDPKGGFACIENGYTIYPRPSGIFYGPNHIKYDKNGARFAFILKWEWWKMHRVKMICNEACAEVLLVEWPDLLDVPKLEFENYKQKIDPATLTPDQFEYQVRHYFSKEQTR